MTTPTELRLRLRAAGFNPIPAEGKRPAMEGWQLKLDTTENEIRLWPSVWHLAPNTSVLGKRTPGADIDIRDEDAAEAVEHLARSLFAEGGRIALRIGEWPKRLIPLRTDEPFTKLRSVFRAPDGSEHKIEVLGDGQQWVAFGVHPDTKAPYRWTHGEPGKDFAREDLPYVRREDMERFLDAAEELLIEQHGWTLITPLPQGNGGAPGGEPLAASSRVAAAVHVIPNDDLGWDDWNRVCMAIWRATNGSGEGFAIFDAWSQRSAKYQVRATAKKWSVLTKSPPDRIGFGTLKYSADQADPAWEEALRGEPPEPDPEDPGPRPPPGWKPSATNCGDLRPEDFYAYMLEHKYIFVPTRQLWPAASVDARLPPIGKVRASAWLDSNRPVEQMTWAPGEPLEIADRLIAEGGWIPRQGCRVFNLYRAPIITPIAGNADPWRHHLEKLYGQDAAHIVRWCAQRVQSPHSKINHALVLGGKQGIGKDTLLEPVKYAVGAWNFLEASPQQVLGRFNGFLKSVILRVSEARDLGEFDRFAFYDHMKQLIAAPPDTLRIDEKNRTEYYIANVTGIVITTNHKADGIFLPADDRRHFVAWSDLDKNDFSPVYWNELWRWYNNGGCQVVAQYLLNLDLSAFNPKAPPPQTDAFFEIANASRSPEDAELADALDALCTSNGLTGWPAAVTIADVVAVATHSDFADYLKDRRNSRKIPHRFEACGYIPVRNRDAVDGLWAINSRRQVVYARADLNPNDRYSVASGRADRR